MFASILLPNGATFAQYTRPGAAAVPAPADADVRAGRPWSAFEDGLLIVMRPIQLDRDVLGTVRIATDLDQLQIRAAAFVRIIALAFLAAAGVAWALAWRLQRVISVPLVRLASVTRAVTRERRYDIRADATGNGDEIGELIGGFNEMLDQIQARDATLLQHRDALEQTVEARTAELRATNTDLVVARDQAMEASRAKSEFSRT